jgi:DNA repair exonuclease SbcCD ATPase subunit
MVRIVFMSLIAAAAAAAQDKPAGSFSSLQQNVDKRTADWQTLANNLELRIGRLLPCDSRTKSAIEEVSRASEARIVALTEYWQAVSAASKNQTEAVRRLIAQEEASAADRKLDQADAEQARIALTAQLADLTESAKRLASHAPAQKSLDALAQASSQMAAQAAERGQSAERLKQELRDLMAATEARQTAIEGAMKALAAEGLRWSAYYSARESRAETECSITNQGAGAGNSAPKPAGPGRGKKQ